jgi:transposase
MAKTESGSSKSKTITIPDPLPDTIEKCHDLIRALAEYITEKQHQIRRQNRDKFGPRSAQTPGDNLTGSGKDVYDKTKQSIKDEKASRGIPEEADTTHSGGGRTIPTLGDNEQIIKHELTGSALLCPCCSTERTTIGFNVSLQLEYIPAKFKRIKHVEFNYSCPNCRGNIATATKPYQPIDKGYAGPGLLAHIITSKMAYHLPLYRQEQIFNSLGFPIKRSTLSRWLKQCADELTILYDLMRSRALMGRIIFNDETGMPFILKGNGKVAGGSIWIFGGDDEHPYNIYKFAKHGCGTTIEEFLSGFFGVVLTDGTSKLDEFFKTKDKDGKSATSARCWAHVYRYFEDARHAEEKEADHALGVIKSLFLIDSLALTLPEDECVALRQKLSKPLLDKFKIWLDEQKLSAAPTSLLKAVKYTIGLWPGLLEFLNHGFIKLHNNDSENALRSVVLGRRNGYLQALLTADRLLRF